MAVSAPADCNLSFNVLSSQSKMIAISMPPICQEKQNWSQNYKLKHRNNFNGSSQNKCNSGMLVLFYITLTLWLKSSTWLASRGNPSNTKALASVFSFIADINSSMATSWEREWDQSTMVVTLVAKTGTTWLSAWSLMVSIVFIIKLQRFVY